MGDKADLGGDPGGSLAKIDIGIGYTLATGRLFCEVRRFHEYAEELLQRPIFTHEFGDKRLWDELRSEFEARVLHQDSATAEANAKAPNA